MTVKSGWFDAVNGDRTYNSKDMSGLFKGMIADGVLPSVGTMFAVVPGTGMNIVVGQGRAWFDGIWVDSDSDLTLSILPSAPILTRTDALIVEINKNTAVRAGTIKILSGTPGATNPYPVLTNSGGITQYVLGYIWVSPGSTQILASNYVPKIGSGGAGCAPIATSLVSVPVAPGTLGNVMTSMGDRWESRPASSPVLLPVGAIYMSTIGTNPATVLGYGTWVAFGQGRVIIGAGTSDMTFAAGSQGGSSTVTLTPEQMPTHTHIQNAHAHSYFNGEEAKWRDGDQSNDQRPIASQGNTGETTAINQNAGGGQAHSNLPPFIVAYFFTRTA